MRFFTFFICLGVIFLAGLSITAYALPNNVEKPAFLQHMLENDSIGTNTKKMTPQKDSKKIPAPIEEDLPVKKKRKLFFISKMAYSLLNIIQQSGGKKIWNAILPKHVRRARIVKSLQVLDALSFVMGFLVLYTIVNTLANKTDLLFSYSSLLFNSINAWGHKSDQLNHVAVNLKEETEDEQFPYKGNSNSQNYPIVPHWVPPTFIKKYNNI
ncbi:hypothetical protein EKK58_04235 [Candidatus Dependentiae bacterium]|nr:MAG: hypothetical protein EKK58_04235 [Candidatus Dependentiae bacterium]